MVELPRPWYWLLGILMLTGMLGPFLCNAGAQEGHEEARGVVIADEASESEARETRQPEARERGERPTERDILKRQIEVLKIALHALLEADKQDAADVLRRAIRAQEVSLEGRRDDEAHMIRERAPARGQLAEILTMSSNLWREFNNQDKAEVVGRLAREFAGARERERTVRERRQAEEREHPFEDVRRRHQELEQQARRIKQALEGLRDDQDEEAREMQAKLREVTAQLQELQRVHRRPEGGRDELRGRLHELEQAFVRAREAGKEEEARRIRRQMEELVQQTERRRSERPAAAEAPRMLEEVERMKGSIRELNGQVNELRREMAEMRQLLKKLVERMDEDG